MRDHGKSFNLVNPDSDINFIEPQKAQWLSLQSGSPQSGSPQSGSIKYIHYKYLEPQKVPKKIF